MKRIAILTCFCALFVFSYSYSQTREGAYLNVDYLKVDTKDLSAFEEFVKTEWKSVYKSEIAEDRINGCYFYRVEYPGGQLNDYNYVLVRTFSDLNKILESKERFREKLASRKGNLMKKTLDLVDHQYSELWRTEAGIVDTTDENLSKFAVINFMRVEPGKEPEYLALENDIARPLHEERIAQNMMHGWQTYSLLKPGGVEYNYNFATADYYNNLKNIEYVFTNDIVQSVMPNANITETLEAMYITRDIVRSELWKLIDALE